MEKFITLESKIIPIALSDIDTDMIIPAQYLTSVSREGYAENLFRRLKDTEKNFPLNKPEYKDAKILVCGDNFGCGSSREHAVWAILGAGIRVVISSSFADIFASNSGKNGLVLVSISAEDLQEILQGATESEYRIEVNLEEQDIRLPGGRKISFPFDSFRKHCILNGHDDMDYLLSKKSEISDFRKKQEPYRFFTTEKENNS